MAYITCEDLTLGYEKTIVAEHVSFSVEKGDYLCIVGENGAGKSTLMKTLLHLIEPLGGKLLMGDGLSPHEIGYLPQQTEVQRDFPASVGEIVLSGTLPKCGKHPFYRKKEKELADEMMRKLGIAELKKRCYRYLSGGQKQRVLLARALCASEKALLLDEPVTGLDPKASAEFYRLLAALHQEGLTILMVSHDIKAAASYATHILHLEKETSFFGTKEDYSESKAWRIFSGEKGNQNE